MSRRRSEIDGMAARHVAECIASPGWQLIQQRYEATLARWRDDLERPSDAVPTARIRGNIEALKLALGIPKQLIEEGRKGIVDEETTL